MKKLLLPLLLVPALACGQASFGHLDSIKLSRMQNALKTTATGQAASDETLTFFMRVSDDATVDRIVAAGARVDQREGNILVVTAPLARAEAIAATEGVVTVSLPKEMNLHEWSNPMGADVSRSWLGLDRIQSAQAPLSQAYTGNGVIIGFIDSGIDVHHISLLDSDGKHRVKRAWKHVANGKATLTLTADTEEKVAKFQTDQPEMTHGTHVMGIAAGSFVAPDGNAPEVRGAAPEADLAVSCGVADNVHLLKGARAIADYAKSEGRPCVINISMGNNSGPHDGTDEFPAGLNEIAGEEGITVFVSAGNEGSDPAFLYRDFSDDSTPLQSLIAPSDYTAVLWPGISLYPQAIGTMEIWGNDARPFTVHLDLVRIENGKPKVLSTLTLPETGTAYKANPNITPVSSGISVEDDSDFNSVYHHSYIGGAGEVYAANNRYHVELAFQLECGNAESLRSNYMALRIEGNDNQRVFVYGIPQNSYFPYSLLSKGLDGYTDSTADGSVNALAGASNVVTVGSYVTHNMSYNSMSSDDVPGTTAPYSSWGHTVDGRLHPMVSAPGSRIVSSMSSDYVNRTTYNETDQPKYYSYKADNGTTYHWTPMSGTSMASPFMTGVAAMWLSADPTLTTDDIVAIAQETAFEPTEPRYNDGVGAHVNAFAGLCKILNLSGVKNVSLHDCPYTLIRNGNTFTVQSPASCRISASVYSLQGEALTVAASSDNTPEISVDCSSLTPGVYVLSIDIDGLVKSEKILVK